MRSIVKLTAIAALLIIPLISEAQTTNYNVHSLFVLNIARYSTWPNHGGDFNITIFGRSKMYDELIKVTAGKNINGMPIKVNVTESITEIGEPKIIFLADSKSSNLGEILKLTEGKSIMVIAEREGLYKKGAGFSFVLMENNTLRYDINNSEIERRQIRISKNLSTLANSVM